MSNGSDDIGWRILGGIALVIMLAWMAFQGSKCAHAGGRYNYRAMECFSSAAVIRQ